MLLKHVGLVCRTEDHADRFYRDLLGLNKSEPKKLTSDLSRAIFNLDVELQLIDYKNDDTHFEVFITNLIDFTPAVIAHQCLEVGDLPEFIDRCRDLNVEINQIPKGGKILTFIKDFDGNLLEIKEL